MKPTTIAALVELGALGKDDWECALQQILRIDAGVLDVERVSYWSFRSEPRGVFCELGYQLGPRAYERGGHLLEEECPPYFAAIRTPEVLISESVLDDPRLRGLEPYLRAHGIIAMMDVPIWVRSDLAGILCHEHVVPRQFGREDAEFALAVSQSLSAALEARQRSGAEAEAVRSQFLADVSVRLNTLDVERIAQDAMALAVNYLADWAVLDVSDEGKMRRLAFMHRLPEQIPLLSKASRVYSPETSQPNLCSLAMRLGQSILHPMVTEGQLARYTKDAEHAALIRALGCRSVMAVPLFVGGQLFGAIALSSATRSYDQNDLRLTEEFAERISSAVRNARLYREAQEAVVVRDEFLSLAAHELRTPLNGIQLSVDRLELQLEQTPLKEATPFKVLVRQVNRLSQLAEQLLDASQLGRRALAIQPQSLDLVGLVEDVVEEFHYRLESAGCVVKIESSGPVIGCWDPLRMARVLTNLLDNAIKFAAKTPIEVSVTSADGNARLIVRDHGTGIPPERLHDIFEPYKRAVPARHFGGLGLGLYVVRAIVEAHGGTVAVRSSPGEGTEFTLNLPQSRADEPPRT